MKNKTNKQTKRQEETRGGVVSASLVPPTGQRPDFTPPFLLQPLLLSMATGCVCVLGAQSYLTLCDTTDCM